MTDNSNRPMEWMRAVLWLLGKLALITGLIVGGVYTLGRLKMVLMYIFVAVILAYPMRSVATIMCERGILVSRKLVRHKRRMLATGYVLIVLLVSTFYFCKFTITPFVEEINKVSTQWPGVYKPRIDQYAKEFNTWYEANIKSEWRKKIAESLSGGNGDASKAISSVAGGLAEKVGGLAHQIVEIVLLPVLAFYFALDSKKLKHEALATVPKRWRREVSRTIYEFNKIMNSFVVGQVILCTLAGVGIGLLLKCMGVPYALTLGLLAGVTRAIPIIGPILGGIPIIGLTFVTSGMSTALIILAVFTVLHFVETKFIMPWLIGERMELHPVVIIIVLLIGQEFGGLIGMFFAAPVAALLRVLVRRYYLKTYHRVKVVKIAAA